MLFKHWKEAEARAAEIKTELDALITEIGASEVEARKEDLEIEKRGEMITAIQAMVIKRDGLQDEYGKVIVARDTLKQTEERQFGLLANVSAQKVEERLKHMGKENVYETRSYELAWAEYIRSGNDAEVRSLISTQNAESAGIMVPHTLVNKIEDTLRTGGRLLALCSITSIKGITEYPIAKSRTDPELHDETGTAKKKDKSITLTSVSIEPQFIAETLETTRKFEEDSISAFWDWLNAELPDALKRVVDKLILMGGVGGKEGIHGILTNAEPMFVETLPNHVLNFNTANIAVSYLADGAEQNITAVMNKKTFLQNVMGLTGLDGHPVYQQVMNTNLGKPAFFIGGYPVVFTDELPAYDKAAAGKPYMLFGDFSAMKLNFPNGMNVRLIRDELTRKKDNIIEYLSEIYVGGNITRLGCFVKVTK